MDFSCKKWVRNTSLRAVCKLSVSAETREREMEFIRSGKREEERNGVVGCIYRQMGHLMLD